MNCVAENYFQTSKSFILAQNTGMLHNGSITEHIELRFEFEFEMNIVQRLLCKDNKVQRHITDGGATPF